MGEVVKTWTHTLCEVCWFKREPHRFPTQVRREADDLVVDYCCFCDSAKVTRIYVRHNPEDAALVCAGKHPED